VNILRFVVNKHETTCEAQTEMFASSEEASELPHFMNMPFTNRFHETYTRTNIMEPNVNDCSADAICSIVPTCAICIKWDTLAVEDYEDVDPYAPPPCEQQKLDQIKAEITARYMKEIQKLRQSIILSYAVKCLNAGNVVDKVEASYDQKLYHYTLYYYDRAGRLVRTVSPKGVDINPTRTVSATPAHTFVSRFMTDSRGRMLVKTVPDGGSERYEYDKYGRLRFIVDAEQNAAASKRMTYFKYDALDRIIETGEVEELGDLQGLENAIQNRDEASWPTAADYDRSDVAVYVYDHPANTTVGNSAESGWTHVSSTSGLVQRNLRHRLSWAYAVPHWPEDESFANLSNVVRTFFTYDAQGNATAVVNDIPHSDQSSPNGTARLVKRTDYRYDHSTGAPLAVDYQVHGVDNDDDRFQHRYEYDANGRLKIVETSRNGVMWDRDVVYDYNLDGSLRRETIGEDSVQGRDYTYTITRKLKGINHPSLDRNSDPGGDGLGDVEQVHRARVGRDLFGMSLGYHQNDFDRTYNANQSQMNSANSSMVPVSVDLYSGLSDASSYRTASNSNTAVHRAGFLLGDIIRYDRLGRLRSSTSALYDNSWMSDGDGGWTSKYSVDGNSNLVRVERWGFEGPTQNQKYDDATLTYASNGSNALISVSDAGTSLSAPAVIELKQTSSGDFAYDASGRTLNATMGANENSNTYNSMNRLHALTRGDQNVVRLHDASGQIVRSDVYQTNLWEKSVYVIPGSIATDLAVYNSASSGEVYIQEWGIYGSRRLGVDRSVDPSSFVNVHQRRSGEKLYELIDHIGSVRAIVSDVKLYEQDGFTGQIKQHNDYESYGSLRSMRYSGIEDADIYRYGFQGLRLSVGVEHTQEYQPIARYYDPRTGRWGSTDPNGSSYPSQSAYVGFGGSPGLFIDPDGRDIYFYDNAGLPLFVIQNHSVDVAYQLNISGGRKGHPIIGDVDEILPLQAIPFIPQTTPDVLAFSISGEAVFGAGMSYGMEVALFLRGSHAGQVHLYGVLTGNLGLSAGVGVNKSFSYYLGKKDRRTGMPMYLTPENYAGLSFGYSLSADMGGAGLSGAIENSYRKEVNPGLLDMFNPLPDGELLDFRTVSIGGAVAGTPELKAGGSWYFKMVDYLGKVNDGVGGLVRQLSSTQWESIVASYGTLEITVGPAFINGIVTGTPEMQESRTMDSLP
jgi:RHS repeat-associated protein